jgi:hypothetical protein
MKEKIAAVASTGSDSGNMMRPVDAPGSAAIHDRCLVDLARNATEELHHQEDEEGVDCEEFRHDERQKGVHPSKVQEEDVLRNKGHVIGQHQRAHHQREPEPLEAKFQPRKSEGGERAGGEVADHCKALRSGTSSHRISRS